MKQIEYAILATYDNIIRARESRYWHIDATFKHPAGFSQIIVIQIIDELTKLKILTFFKLTNKKTEMTYYIVFQDIRTILEKGFKEKIKLVNYTHDFEMAMNNALTSVFPGIRRTGCYFHYKKSNDRYLGKYGFKKEEYNQTKEYILLELGLFL